MKRKSLLALAFAVPLSATTFNTIHARLTPGEANEKYVLESDRSFQSYPDLRGDQIRFIEKIPYQPMVSIEFDRDDDGFTDVKYYHSIKKIHSLSSFSLENPLFVLVDKNKNKKIDEGELVALNGKKSRNSNFERGVLYPTLKGDNIASLEFFEFSGKIFVNIRFDINNDGVADLMYTYPTERIDNYFSVEKPFSVRFDINNDGIFNPEDGEVFDLRKVKYQ